MQEATAANGAPPDAYLPPVTSRNVPVMKDASSLASHKIARATSSGWSPLPMGIESLTRSGMQGVAVVRFTLELSKWDPETFVRNVLVEWLHVVEVWVGANFLFGHERAGNFSVLRSLGARQTAYAGTHSAISAGSGSVPRRSFTA